MITPVLCGIVALSISIADIIGWITGTEFLTTFGKGFIPMAPTTAILLIISSVALLIVIPFGRNPSVRVVGISAAVLIIGFSFPMLVMEILEVKAPFPNFGFGEQGEQALPAMGHMSSGTSLLFTLSGLTALFLMLGRKSFVSTIIPQAISGIILLISVVFLGGYILGKPLFYDSTQVPMALNTAVAFAASGLALTSESAYRWIRRENSNEFRHARSLHAFAMVIAFIITGILFFGYFNILANFNAITNGIRNELTLISETTAREAGNQISRGKKAEELKNLLEWPLSGQEGTLSIIPDTAKLSGSAIFHGISEIEDRNRVKWIIFATPVEGTNLTVVAKRNKMAAFRPLISQFIQMTTLIICLLALTVSVLILFGRQTRLRYYKKQLLSSEKLRMAEEQFRNAFEHSSVGKTMIYVDGRYMVNQAFAEMLGYSIAELEGKSWNDITHPDDRQKNLDTMDLMIGGEKESVRFEKRYLHRDGHSVWVDLQSYLQRDKDENPIYFITSASNISEYKLMEEQLIRSKEEAERSNRLKDAFIANISHEIRTPLNAIIGFSDLIRDEMEEQKIGDYTSYFEIIHSSGNRLTRTVDMILNLSRLQVGEYEPHVTDLRPDGIIRGLIAEYRLVAQKKGLEINYENSVGDKGIRGDDYCVTHSISNLIDNAVKYTQTGLIRIMLYESPEGNVCLDVKDTGIGISDEFMPQLFNPFTQEDPGSTRRFEGIGLGLSIVYRLLTVTGATITARSNKGEGTTFTITFPSREK
jgi:PAS domain S-box-containing protein